MDSTRPQTLEWAFRGSALSSTPKVKVGLNIASAAGQARKLSPTDFLSLAQSVFGSAISPRSRARAQRRPSKALRLAFQVHKLTDREPSSSSWSWAAGGLAIAAQLWDDFHHSLGEKQSSGERSNSLFARDQRIVVWAARWVAPTFARD